LGRDFKQVTLNPAKCRSEITELNALLQSKAALSEWHDIQPFFKSHEQLSALLGSYTAVLFPSITVTGRPEPKLRAQRFRV
jgi:hypothetical protein